MNYKINIYRIRNQQLFNQFSYFLILNEHPAVGQCPSAARTRTRFCLALAIKCKIKLLLSVARFMRQISFRILKCLAVPASMTYIRMYIYIYICLYIAEVRNLRFFGEL